MTEAALVTGGAAGIGRAIAEAFGRAGARVAILDVDAAGTEQTLAELRAVGTSASARVVDIADAAAVAAAVEELADGGAFVSVVNNAAVQDTAGSVVEATPEDWDRQLAVTLRGAANVSRAAIPAMERAGGGSIINIASISGLAGFPGQAAYAAAKGALVQLTRAMAVDHGPRGIRVNCVCPGPTLAGPVTRGRTPEEALADPQIRALLERHPLRRLAHPEDIAAVVLFLAAPGARHVTGAVLPVDGGFTV